MQLLGNSYCVYVPNISLHSYDILLVGTRICCVAIASELSVFGYVDIYI